VIGDGELARLSERVRVERTDGQARWALGQVGLQDHRHAGHLANVLDEVAALLAQGEQIKVRLELAVFITKNQLSSCESWA